MAPTPNSNTPNGRAAPTHLVERPKVRFGWCGGFLIVAAALAWGAVVTYTGGDTGASALLGGFGLLSLAAALSGLRFSIVADHHGVSITNYGRPHNIAWADLDDVRLEAVQAEMDLGFHYIVFVTAGGKRVRAAAPTGRNKPGGKMVRLQQDLLAMRDRYAP